MDTSNRGFAGRCIPTGKWQSLPRQPAQSQRGGPKGGFYPVPQWPAVGDTMATAIQSALVGQATPADALKDAQKKIDKILKT